MKVAIIGSGIAGNTLAWKLDAEHDVSVFEAGSYLGGHTHTHSVELEGKQINVDSGFIVFNERTYPNFLSMLEALGVEKQATEMSFSVHCEHSGFEYAGTNINTLFAQRSNLASPRFYKFIADILRFNRESPVLLNSDEDGITLGEYLRDEGYSDFFCHYYILPMGAAIWSQSLEAMLDFPAQFFIRFFANHGLLSINDRPQWYVVKGGSKSYVEKIYRGFSGEVYLQTPVQQVRRSPDYVEILSNRGWERFDALFFACHSDQALALLADASTVEKNVLSALPYQTNQAVLHLGDDLLPARKIARSSWNYRLNGNNAGAATVTYDMKKLQSLPLQGDICVTLNGAEAIDESKVLASMSYDHPLFTRQGMAAQRQIHAINGSLRTFYSGAYWRNGFHEDGVVSAQTALEHFEQWKKQHGNMPLHRAS